MTPPLSKIQLNSIHKIYYDDHNLFGRDKLYKILQEQNLDISRRQVMEWLKEQPVYQRYLPTKKNRVIQPTILSKPYQQLGIDLMDLQNLEYNGYKYILTIVDLFSKKIWAYPLKNKQDKTVASRFNSFLRSVPHISTVRSDRGSEFISHAFKKVLAKHKVKQILSLPYKPQSNGNVERMNGVLKRLINMTIKSTNNNNWVKVLPQLVNNYNNSINTTTKKTPNQVSKEAPQQRIKTKQQITKRVLKGRTKDIQTISLFDRVRIKLKPNELDRNKQLWSSKVYSISKIINPRNRVSSTKYKVKGLNSIFYNQDLQPIRGRSRLEEPTKWEVSKIVKPTIRNGVASYFVKWLGVKDLTIEPRSVLIEDIPKLIRRFEKTRKVVWTKNRVRWLKNK